MHRDLISKTALIFVVANLVGGLIPHKALADKRRYVWTYEYLTMDRGEGEIEQYLTFSSPDAGAQKGRTTSDLWLEYEVGMSDRFDFSVYNMFQQKPDQSLKYVGYKFRWRYRFGEKNRYLMDPLLYLEYKGKPDFSEHGVEFKLILAKDWGKWNTALNPYVELNRKSQWKTTPKYAVGVSYQPHKLLSIGVEIKGSEKGHYWGPVISHGKGNLWIAIGSAFHMSDVKPGEAETQLRLIVGYEVG